MKIEKDVQEGKKSSHPVSFRPVEGKNLPKCAASLTKFAYLFHCRTTGTTS
jgi:hypothetical protein